MAHYHPLAAHAHVASDPFLLTFLHLTMKHGLYLQEIYAKNALIYSSLIHEVWVRFLTGYELPYFLDVLRFLKYLYTTKEKKLTFRGGDIALGGSSAIRARLCIYYDSDRLDGPQVLFQEYHISQW